MGDTVIVTECANGSVTIAGQSDARQTENGFTSAVLRGNELPPVGARYIRMGSRFVIDPASLPLTLAGIRMMRSCK